MEDVPGVKRETQGFRVRVDSAPEVGCQVLLCGVVLKQIPTERVSVVLKMLSGPCYHLRKITTQQNPVSELY